MKALLRAIAEKQEAIERLRLELAALELAASIVGADEAPPATNTPKLTERPYSKRRTTGARPTAGKFNCGHPTTPENTRANGKCMQCRKDVVARYEAKKAGKRVAPVAEAPPASPKLSTSSGSPSMRSGTCTARDAESGKQCTRPAHGDAEHSASGRAFRQVLPAGAAPPERSIDRAATSRTGSQLTAAGV